MLHHGADATENVILSSISVYDIMLSAGNCISNQADQLKNIDLLICNPW
jgi:hypothetical protein